jgi:hypothetical protein
MLKSGNKKPGRSDEDVRQDTAGILFDMTPPEDSIDPDYRRMLDRSL